MAAKARSTQHLGNRRPRGLLEVRRASSSTAAAWRADVALLADQHRQLREAVASSPHARLARRTPGSAFTGAALVRGAAAHDLYHAGQIQLLKRLARS
jgi:hypothetical protein